jgi:glycosyltransferase involved in cell wall biosynthesis
MTDTLSGFAAGEAVPEPRPGEPACDNPARAVPTESPDPADPEPATDTVATLRAELGRQDAKRARAEAQALREARRADMADQALQRSLASYERQINALKRSNAFRLGAILLGGFKSFGTVRRLPGQLLALQRENSLRRQMQGRQSLRALGGKDYPYLLARLKSDGFEAACAMIEGLALQDPARANAYTALSRQLRGKDPAASARAARIASEADPHPWRAKWLAFRLHDAGQLVEPARMLRDLSGEIMFSASEETSAAQIEALANLFELRPVLPYPIGTRYIPKPDALLYVAASVLPYHVSGYTLRTGALVGALKAAGVDLTVATRPGYPWDRHDSLQSARAATTALDGITYHHFRQPAQDLPLDVYIERAAAAIARLALEKQVAAIHAASNHVNALPALIAARTLGIPFHFEIRGLWEMSRASNVEGFEESERYRLGLELERFVASHADRVYAISQPLAQLLIQDWGIAPDKIAILSNGIDSAGFRAITPQRPARFTIGYAGAMVPYEGLDLLLDAVAQLRAGGADIALRLIGDGSARKALEARTRDLRLEGAVEFLGKLPYEAARRHIAACSLVCLPRRPDRVCELVPPIKLVETMALGVPVVVPDLPAFRAEAEDGVTALFFRAGDSADLARAIAQVRADPEATEARALEARERALTERDWGHAAAAVREALGAIKAGPTLAELGEDLPEDNLTDLLIDPTHLAARFEADGIAPFVTMIDRQPGLSKRDRAREFMRVGSAFADVGLDQAETLLVEELLRTDRSPAALGWAYRTYERFGAFEQTRALLDELSAHPDVASTPAGATRIEKLKGGLAHQLSLLDLIAPRAPLAFTPVANRICYMLHNSLPYSSGGYATRSHGVASGLRAAGFDVQVMTRPGYPHDIVADLKDTAVPLTDEIDGIAYHRTLEPQRRTTKFIQYVPEAARVLEERFRALRPALVVSASNYVVALPALIACRRLGIPFVYEVRGFWEVTRGSREFNYSESAAYKLQSRFEAAVGAAADHIFTLTQPMREELIGRSVDPRKIDLLPNACDPEKFMPRQRDEALAASLGIPAGVPVIGYVGTFVDYEGLEDLARACGLLKQRGHTFRLLLVGNENTSGTETGPITQMIADAAAEAGFSDWLIMPGRVPHALVHSYYSLLDICPFPRKPWPVCEMVSPMKPLEALAMEKLVIVSSVRALVEMIADGRTGLVFAKGDITSLADTLERAMTSPQLRAELGKAGRIWVEQQRTWRALGEKAAGILARFATPEGAATPTAPARPAAAPDALPGSPPADAALPEWWPQLPESFRSRCDYVSIKRWKVGEQAMALRSAYVDRFGEEAVQKRMPLANWKRADICVGLVPPDQPLLDIGSGLGEFVNLFCQTNTATPLSSVDLKDYDLWMDATGRINRIYKSLLDLEPDEAHEVVTCFEVIEHLPTKSVEAAVAKLRSLAKRRLYVSVPFMEPLPLYRGHRTRFDPELITALFPDARLTIFDKGTRVFDKMTAWILCEVRFD